jgi:hypothetical protein
MPTETALPSLYEYALAQRCPACRAEPGLPCNAPRKQGAIAARYRLRAQLGHPQPDLTPEAMLHTARQDAGRRRMTRTEHS